MEKQDNQSNNSRIYAKIANRIAREAVFTLTRSQFDLLFVLLSKTKPDDDPDRWYRISVKELCNALYIDLDKSGTYYKRIKADLDKLNNARWCKTKDGEFLLSWLQNADHGDAVRVDDEGRMTINDNVDLFNEIKDDDPAEGMLKSEYEVSEETQNKSRYWSGNIHYRFNAYLQHYLINLTGNYTLIELNQVITFVKPLSIRLYMYLKSFVYKEKLESNEPVFVKANLTELRRIITCVSETKKVERNPENSIKYFIRDAIKPAVEEINRKSSEFHVEFTMERDPYTKSYKNIRFMLTKAGYTQIESAKSNLELMRSKVKKA